MSQASSTEPQWYYSQGGRECGPVPMPRLAELAAAGTVKPTDLVWREGMDDWTAASNVAGLFHVAPPPSVKPATPPAATRTGEKGLGSATAVARNAWAELIRPGSRAAQWFAITGIMLVILSRGCDTLNHRNVARTAARQAAAKQQFEDNWESRRLAVQQQIDKLTAKPTPAAEDQTKLTELRKELADMLKQQGEQRKELTEGTWRDLEVAARHTKLNHAMWAYWHEMFFVLGAIVFTVGLILVGFGSQGPERWIALGMLAIITYSLFVSGTAWTGAAPTP